MKVVSSLRNGRECNWDHTCHFKCTKKISVFPPWARSGQIRTKKSHSSSHIGRKLQEFTLEWRWSAQFIEKNICFFIRSETILAYSSLKQKDTSKTRFNNMKNL